MALTPIPIGVSHLYPQVVGYPTATTSGGQGSYRRETTQDESRQSDSRQTRQRFYQTEFDQLPYRNRQALGMYAQNQLSAQMPQSDQQVVGIDIYV